MLEGALLSHLILHRCLNHHQCHQNHQNRHQHHQCCRDWKQRMASNNSHPPPGKVRIKMEIGLVACCLPWTMNYRWYWRGLSNDWQTRHVHHPEQRYLISNLVGTFCWWNYYEINGNGKQWTFCWNLLKWEWSDVFISRFLELVRTSKHAPV